jgi:hypothetical protein
MGSCLSVNLTFVGLPVKLEYATCIDHPVTFGIESGPGIFIVIFKNSGRRPSG